MLGVEIMGREVVGHQQIEATVVIKVKPESSNAVANKVQACFFCNVHKFPARNSICVADGTAIVIEQGLIVEQKVSRALPDNK
jgi:hypothetical protein